MYLVLHIVISHFNYKLQKDKTFQSLGPHDNSQNINNKFYIYEVLKNYKALSHILFHLLVKAHKF